MSSALHPASFVRPTIELRVAAARRFLRPMTLVLFDVEGAQPSAVAVAAGAVLREGDVVGWFADGGPYALVLEDTSDAGAVEAMARMRDRLGGAGSGCAVVAAISGYPTQGIEASEIVSRACAALDTARARTDGTRDVIELA